MLVDFRGKKYILGVITDTIARPYVVEYSKERFDGFEQGITSIEHFPCSARLNSEKPTCAVVP